VSRGKVARSTTATRTPLRPSSAASGDPAHRAPTTTTSNGQPYSPARAAAANHTPPRGNTPTALGGETRPVPADRQCVRAPASGTKRQTFPPDRQAERPRIRSSRPRPASSAGASSPARTAAILAMLPPLGAERFKLTVAPAAPPYCEVAHTTSHEQRRELIRLGDRHARPRDEGQCRLGVPALLLTLEDAAPSALWPPFLG
jgi:hypothetical protein